MPSDREPDQHDLEQQLRAFGATLAHSTGEPIAPDGASVTPIAAAGSRRRWALVGAAACVVALVGGLVAFGRSDPPEQGAAVVPTTGQFAAAPLPLTDAFVVPGDPLALSELGFPVVDQQAYSPFGVVDTTSCEEYQELTALGGGYVVTSSFRNDADEIAFIQIQFARYADGATARAALAPMTDFTDCGGYPAPVDVTPIDVSDPASSVSLAAYRRESGLSLLTAAAADGRAMIVTVGNVDDGNVVLDIAGRATRYLEASEPWPVVPPATTLPPDTAFPGTTVPLDTVPARPISDDDRARLSDDHQGLVCDAAGTSGSNWDYGASIGDDEPRGRRPTDAFRDALDEINRDVVGGGGVPLPADGWVELVASESESYFVLEIGGVWQAIVSVSGDPELGVWRQGSAGLCSSLVLPGGTLPPTTAPQPTSPTTRPPVVTTAPPGTFPGGMTVETPPADGPFPEIGATDEVLVLMVSNQSFEDDPVRLTISIDGQQVADDAFEVGSQHSVTNYYVRGLAPGQHEIEVESDTGVSYGSTFTMPVGAPHWGFLTYWYYPDDGNGRFVDLQESEEPIGIA